MLTSKYLYTLHKFFLHIQLQIVKKQFEENNFVLKSCKSITFDADGCISVAFDPDTIDGWKRRHNGFHTDKVLTMQYLLL